MDLSTSHPRPTGSAAPSFASFSTIRRPSSEDGAPTLSSLMPTAHTYPSQASYSAPGRTSSSTLGHEASHAGAVSSTQAHHNHVPISGLVSHASSTTHHGAASHRAGSGHASSSHMDHRQRSENGKSTSMTSQSNSHAAPAVARPMSTSGGSAAGNAGVFFPPLCLWCKR